MDKRQSSEKIDEITSYCSSANDFSLKLYYAYKQVSVHNFVFLDETYIFQNGTIARSREDADLRFINSTKVDC